MKLWLLTQRENTGWDTYDSAVIAADSEAEARLIHPDGRFSYVWNLKTKTWETNDNPHNWTDDSWAAPKTLTVKYIGEAAPGVEFGVVCASFNAG